MTSIYLSYRAANLPALACLPLHAEQTCSCNITSKSNEIWLNEIISYMSRFFVQILHGRKLSKSVKICQNLFKCVVKICQNLSKSVQMCTSRSAKICQNLSKSVKICHADSSSRKRKADEPTISAYP